MMKLIQDSSLDRVSIIKKFGLFSFLFFLAKGILWLLVPAMLAYLNMS